MPRHTRGPSRQPLTARDPRRRCSFHDGHDGHLFTLGVSGIVAAFDAATGRLLWRTEATAEPPFFSAASSPVAEGDLVIAHPGNYGSLTAFDTKTGAIKWTAGSDGFFASPMLLTLDGVRQVVTVTQKSVIGVSVADGAVLWQHEWPGGSGGITPVQHSDAIIVSGHNEGVAAFRPRKRGGAWMTETVWATKDVSRYVSNPGRDRRHAVRPVASVGRPVLRPRLPAPARSSGSASLVKPRTPPSSRPAISPFC